MNAITPKKKRNNSRTELLDGCSVSAFSVYPANWNQAGADVSATWYIHYRFYDPSHPKGSKLIIAKGMNCFTTLGAKRHNTQQILDEEKDRIIERGYNPIRNTFMQQEAPPPPAPVRSAPIMATDGLWRGIIFARTDKGTPDAWGNTAYTPETGVDVDSYLRPLLRAAGELGLHTLPLKDFKRSTLLTILTHMGRTKPWSPYTWNNCLSYLTGLFSLLMMWEAVEYNPVRDIAKKDTPDVLREILSPADRMRVDTHLKSHHRRFWLFVHIFFHSGAREKELLQLKMADIDLSGQCFTVYTRKGREKLPKPVTHVIKDVALPYWKEYMADAGDGAYLFCRRFLAGKKPLLRSSVSHMWKDIVKDGLGITADLYSLKHLHYDEMDALLDTATAAAQAGHTTTAMSKRYAVKQRERQLEQVKKQQNTFA
jgi:integrase